MVVGEEVEGEGRQIRTGVSGHECGAQRACIEGGPLEMSGQSPSGTPGAQWSG